MAESDVCPVCGTKLKPGAVSCTVCGTLFDDDSQKCPLCGLQLAPEDRVCPGCGMELALTEEEDVTEGQEKNGAEVEQPEGEGAPSEETSDPGEGAGKDEEEPEDETQPPEIEGTAPDEDEAVEEAVPEKPPEGEGDAPVPEEKKLFVEEELEELVKVPGIGLLKAKILYDAGYTDLRKLKQATVVELMKVNGIGRKAAGEIKTALRDIDIGEIRQTELKEEDVESEYQCPLCGTVVSEFENSCYECGTVFDRRVAESGDADRLALSYYDSKLLRDPNNQELWYARGATLTKMGEYDKALNSFDRALEIDSEFQTAWVSKAEVYNKMGNPIKAAECYSHIISKSGATLEGEEGFDIEALKVTADDIKEFEEELEINNGKGAPAEPQPETAGEGVAEPVEGEPEPVIEEEAPEAAREELVIDTEIRMQPVESKVEPIPEGLDQKGLRHLLSQRAKQVKPMLLLAKEMDVDIIHAKKLVAKGVALSKKGDLKEAIGLLNDGIADIEAGFVLKMSENIDNLAEMVRELKVSGMDVARAVGMITEAKGALEHRRYQESADTLKNCLELVESAKGE